MVAAALDVDGAEVDDAAEALGTASAVEARRVGASGRGTWNSTLRSWLSICSSLRVLRLGADALQQRAELPTGRPGPG